MFERNAVPLERMGAVAESMEPWLTSWANTNRDELVRCDANCWLLLHKIYGVLVTDTDQKKFSTRREPSGVPSSGSVKL